MYFTKSWIEYNDNLIYHKNTQKNVLITFWAVLAKNISLVFFFFLYSAASSKSRANFHIFLCSKFNLKSIKVFQYFKCNRWDVLNKSLPQNRDSLWHFKCNLFSRVLWKLYKKAYQSMQINKTFFLKQIIFNSFYRPSTYLYH